MAVPTSATALVADFVAGLDRGDVPERVLDPLRQSVPDTVGCALLGSTTGYARLVAEYARSLGRSGDASIWGTGATASTPVAAMANSAACHAWDYDDTLLPAVLHPGSVAFPTAFAVAQRADRPTTGEELLTAVSAGYEVGSVVGAALGGRDFARDGFYVSVPTILVAAMTAAKLMGLDREQIVRTLALATTQAAGLYSATHAKRFNSPKAVLGGIFAADLAVRGLDAPEDALEAEYSGFIGTFSRDPHPEIVEQTIGRFDFEIYHKYYPCIRSNHPTVDNVRLMLEENPEIRADAIGEIVSYVDQLTIDYTFGTTGGGAEGITTPGAALVSLPYCVAALVLEGELTPRQFTPEVIVRSGIQGLMARVRLVADPAIDALPATQRYRCRTEIRLSDGRVVERELIGPKGDPGNRMSAEEMFGKFAYNAGAVLPSGRVEDLFARLAAIEDCADVRTIAAMLSETGPSIDT